MKEWKRPNLPYNFNPRSQAKQYGVAAAGCDVVPRNDPDRIDIHNPKIGARVYRVFSASEQIQLGQKFVDSWRGVLLGIKPGAGSVKYCVVQCDDGTVKEIRSAGMKYESEGGSKSHG